MWNNKKWLFALTQQDDASVSFTSKALQTRKSKYVTLFPTSTILHTTTVCGDYLWMCAVRACGYIFIGEHNRHPIWVCNIYGILFLHLFTSLWCHVFRSSSWKTEWTSHHGFPSYQIYILTPDNPCGAVCNKSAICLLYVDLSMKYIFKQELVGKFYLVDGS